MHDSDTAKLPLLRSTFHGGVTKIRMSRKPNTIQAIAHFFHTSASCSPGDSVALQHHTQAVLMRDAIPEDSEAPVSVWDALVEVMGWRPTEAVRRRLQDSLLGEMRRTWTDAAHLRDVSSTEFPDLEAALCSPPPWLVLIHWVLLYRKDLHLFISSSTDPVPIYYTDMLASLQQRRPDRPKSTDADKAAERCFAVGWLAGPSGTVRDRFVPMERPLWPEKRRGFVRLRSSALPEGETLQSIASLIQRLQQQETSGIVVVAGAGISTSAGVPAFRGSGGLFDRIKQKYPVIEEPSDVFSIEPFKTSKDVQMAFYEVARELLSSAVQPTPAHWFLRLLEAKGVLKRLYTQNIDNLERLAGISDRKLIRAHGSFDTATCLRCAATAPFEDYGRRLLRSKVCRCECGGLLKPNIVFYGEELPARFFSNVDKDVRSCQLLIVMGTSLNVSPVNEIVDSVSPSVPCLLINNEAVGQFCGVDREVWEQCAPSMQEESMIHPMVVEQGNIDEVVGRLVAMLGWAEDGQALRTAAAAAAANGHGPGAGQPPREPKGPRTPRPPREPRERRPAAVAVPQATFVHPKVVLVRGLESFVTPAMVARYLAVARDPVRAADVELLPPEEDKTVTARVTVHTTTALKRLLGRTVLMSMPVKTEMSPDSNLDMAVVEDPTAAAPPNSSPDLVVDLHRDAEDGPSEDDSAASDTSTPDHPARSSAPHDTAPRHPNHSSSSLSPAPPQPDPFSPAAALPSPALPDEPCHTVGRRWPAQQDDSGSDGSIGGVVGCRSTEDGADSSRPSPGPPEPPPPHHSQSQRCQRSGFRRGAPADPAAGGQPPPGPAPAADARPSPTAEPPPKRPRPEEPSGGPPPPAPPPADTAAAPEGPGPVCPPSFAGTA